MCNLSLGQVPLVGEWPMFYRLDSSRVTLRECAWGTPLIALPLLAALKVLRISLPTSADDPNVESLLPFRIRAEGLPHDVQTQFRPVEEELQRCGFVDPVYHWLMDPYTSTRIGMATSRHESGSAFARILYRQWSASSPPRQHMYPFFVTRYRDGTYFVSTAGKADMAAPPSFALQRVVGVSPAELWGVHTQQLSAASFGKTTVLLHSPQELLEAIDAHHAAVRDFHLQRGVFVPRNDPVLPLPAVAAAHGEGGSEVVEAALVAEERNGEQAPEPPPVAAAASMSEQDLVHAATLAEIERLQVQQSSWANALLTLLITIGLFFVISPGETNWHIFLLLVGALFFHELGHLAAMKFFGYRNLRMFFIPFLGAAASGRNYNVAGWKKAVVSLMGPVPGIVLGMAVGTAAIVFQSPMALHASLLLLGLNAFNLLPVLPLDGGWVMHAVLFVRHPMLDAASRLAAALVLLLCGLGGMTALAFLGVLMLMSMPMAYRMAQAVRRLRSRGLEATSPDAQTIPASTARLILDELHSVVPARADVRTRARAALQIFESLNARPPDWPASLAVIGVHGGSFLAAIVFGLVLFLFFY